MKKCDNSKIHISSNFILFINLLIMFVSRYRNYIFLIFKQYKKNVSWPWQWRQYVPSKCPELLAHWQRGVAQCLSLWVYHLAFINCKHRNVSPALIIIFFSASPLCCSCVSPFELLILRWIHPLLSTHFISTACPSFYTWTHFSRRLLQCSIRS
jgi:hypothetical protein